MATTAIPANCAAVTNALILETGRFGPGIFTRAQRKSPIIRYMSKTRGAWENGMGPNVAAVTFERMRPETLTNSWANIAQSDGDSSNACLPPTETVTFGQTTRTYQPQHMAINTEDFCIRDIQFDWQYAEMLKKLTAGFGDVSEVVWENRYTSEYVRLAGHKVTLTNSGLIDVENTTVNGYSNAAAPIIALSQGVLDTIYMDLYREGGDLSEGIEENTNQAIFPLLIGAETSQNLIRNNPGLRDDVRYAYMGKGDASPLIPGISTRRRAYGGYMHDIIPYPRRFILAGGVYLQIDPFIRSAATNRYKWEQNPAYKVAPYEETIIFHEENYQSLAVNTVTNPAPDWNFQPRTWMGSFEPRNILHRTCNPDGTIIFFRALFSDASKPINPKVGWSILHARCGVDLDLANCYES